MAMGKCPHCGGENLNYGSLELEGEGCYFPRTCGDCFISGEEWYSMEYEGQYNLLDKDENELLLDNQKENDSEGTNRRT